MAGRSGAQRRGAGRKRVVEVVVGLSVLAIAIILLSDLPLWFRRDVSGVALVSGGLILAASCASRLRLSSGRRRGAWGAFIACGLLAAAASAWLFYASVATGNHSTVPSDLLRMLCLLTGVAGIVIHPAAAPRRTDLTRMVLDGVVLVGSVVFALSVSAFPPVLAASSSPGLGLLAPVIEIVLAAVVGLLFFRARGTDRAAWGLMSLGLTVYAVSDLIFAGLAGRRGIGLGTFADLGWIAGYGLLALAVIRAPSAPTGGRPVERSPLLGTFVMFGVFLIAAVLNLIVPQRDTYRVAAGMLWLVVLLALMARQILLVLDNATLRRSLERRVTQRSSQLRQVTQQADLLVNSVGDGIYGVDADGLITFVNPAAAAALGYSATDLIGLDAHDTFHAPQADGTPFPREHCYILQAIDREQAATGEEDTYVRADRREIPVEVTASPVSVDDAVRGAVVVFRDVTQRREVDRLKGEFVSMVTHELRTPLTSIRGALGLLAGGALGQLTPRAGRMVQIALDSSERLTRMIDQILDLERIEANVMPMSADEYTAGDLVRGAVEQVAVLAGNAGVRVQVLATPGTVYADPDWVAQTLVNLIGNAIKFSPAGGSVDVHTRVLAGFVEFTIADQGRGIPEPMLEAIFGRFQQVDSSDARQKGGSGLGLAISRSLVERLGGRIWAENNPRGGASFRFTLPSPASAAGVSTNGRRTRSRETVRDRR